MNLLLQNFHLLNSFSDFLFIKNDFYQVLYCIEGTEMRQLGFKVRRLLFLNRYFLLQRAAAIFILERKEGEIGK